MTDPLESIALTCCGNIVFIPIANERDYINYETSKYKGECKNCNTHNPKWGWVSSRNEVKHIKVW